MCADELTSLRALYRERLSFLQRLGQDVCRIDAERCADNETGEKMMSRVQWAIDILKQQLEQTEDTLKEVKEVFQTVSGSDGTLVSIHRLTGSLTSRQFSYEL